MKKIIPVLAVLGSAVAFAVYKMKKDEQKQLMDLDEGLLKDDEEPSFKRTQPIIHEPIHQEMKVEEPMFTTTIQKEMEESKFETEMEAEFVAQPVNNDIQQLMKEAAQEVVHKEPEVVPVHTQQEDTILKKPILEPIVEQVLPPVIEPIMESVQEPVSKPVVEEPILEETYSLEFPHLTVRMVDDIKSMTSDAIIALAKDGDVHEHERPVQHMVSFRTKEHMEGFKSRVINKGFVITKGEAEYDLIVLHISPIDEVRLVNNILYLADQAYAFQGEYRGWQSKVSF